MTKRVRWLALLFAAGAVLAVLAPAGVDAGKTKAEIRAEKEAEQERAERQKGSDLVSDLVMAYRLADLGSKEKSPEMLITAAGILRQLSKAKLNTVTEEPVIENEKGKKTGEDASKTVAKSPSLLDEANALFDEATAMADKQNVKLNELINLVKSRPIPDIGFRDVVGGPRSITRNIGRGATHVFNFNFVCGRPCAIGFRASFPMRIQAVRDDIGHIWIDTITTGGVHNGVPGGNPSQIARVTIRVTNIANQGGNYTLWVN